MTIADGYAILASDLDTIWDSVRSVESRKAEMYEVNSQIISFDRIHSSLVDPLRFWIPPTDAQVLAITATGVDGSHVGGVVVQMTGNINISGFSNTITINGVTPTRSLWCSQQFGVLAGDTIEFAVTSVSHVGSGPLTARLHILYKNRWSKT